MKTLILGDGLLGGYIQNKTKWNYLSRKKDKMNFETIIENYREKLLEYDQILNCIANTDTYSSDRDKHWEINYNSFSKLIDFCELNNKKIIHISTDYIYTFSNKQASEDDVPVHCATWYGYTKLLGDAYIQLKSKNYLLIRTTFKKKPFTYDKAYTNQIGNFDYVDVIGDIIIELINKSAVGIYNVGTRLKSMYELAKETNLNVLPTTELFNIATPTNTSMNLMKLNNFIID